MNIQGVSLALIPLSSIILTGPLHTGPLITQSESSMSDLPSVWLPQIPSWSSSSNTFTVLGWKHNKYGLEFDRLYNFYSSES